LPFSASIYSRRWLSRGTVFTGVCLSVCLSVCLFLCMTSRKPMQLGSPNLTQKCSTMSPGKSVILGQKVKGQDQEAQQTCIGLQSSERTQLPLAAYVSNAGFSQLQCPAARAILLISLRHARQTDRRFFRACSFSAVSHRQNIACVGHATPLSAGFFWFIYYSV